nr:AAA family ATPase [Caldilineaceae bacterium]
SLALLKLARAQAALEGRDYVLPDDIKAYVAPALVHRLILNPELWMRAGTAEEILTGIVGSVRVPVVGGR